MACDLLIMIDESKCNRINSAILLQKNPYYNLSCLDLAVEAKSLNFIALRPVQNLLTEIWNGNRESKKGVIDSVKFIICCLSFGLLAPWLLSYSEFNVKSIMKKQVKIDKKT